MTVCNLTLAKFLCNRRTTPIWSKMCFDGFWLQTNDTSWDHKCNYRFSIAIQQCIVSIQFSFGTLVERNRSKGQQLPTLHCRTHWKWNHLSWSVFSNRSSSFCDWWDCGQRPTEASLTKCLVLCTSWYSHFCWPSRCWFNWSHSRKWIKSRKPVTWRWPNYRCSWKSSTSRFAWMRCNGLWKQPKSFVWIPSPKWNCSTNACG